MTDDLSDWEGVVVAIFKEGSSMDDLAEQFGATSEEVERIIRDALKRQAMP